LLAPPSPPLPPRPPLGLPLSPPLPLLSPSLNALFFWSNYSSYSAYLMNGDGKNKVFFQRSGVSKEYVFFNA
ncbi:MAG: hypothetical protein ACK5NI_01955, partial [bacterium]